MHCAEPLPGVACNTVPAKVAVAEKYLHLPRIACLSRHKNGFWYNPASPGHGSGVAWPGKPNLTPARRSHSDEKNNRWLPQLNICRNRGPRESSRPNFQARLVRAFSCLLAERSKCETRLPRRPSSSLVAVCHCCCNRCAQAAIQRLAGTDSMASILGQLLYI